MKLIIQSKNVNLNQNIKEYTEKKFYNLKKYFDHIIEIDTIFSLERSKSPEESHYIDVTLWANGITMHAEERAESFNACVDLALEKLEKQVKKYKEKLKAKKRKLIKKEERLAIDNVISINTELEEETTPKIIRSRRFSIKPMFVDEAALQLSILNQDFLVFTNADTDKINVIYKRRDGNFGLISPDEE